MKKEVFSFIISLLEKHGPIPAEADEERMAYRYLEVAHIDSFGLNEFIMEIEDQIRDLEGGSTKHAKGGAVMKKRGGTFKGTF